MNERLKMYQLWIGSGILSNAIDNELHDELSAWDAASDHDFREWMHDNDVD